MIFIGIDAHALTRSQLDIGKDKVLPIIARFEEPTAQVNGRVAYIGDNGVCVASNAVDLAIVVNALDDDASPARVFSRRGRWRRGCLRLRRRIGGRRFGRRGGCWQRRDGLGYVDSGCMIDEEGGNPGATLELNQSPEAVRALMTSGWPACTLPMMG